MKALIQRVSRASVEIDGEEVSSIDMGMLVLLGVMKGDTEKDLEYLPERPPGSEYSRTARAG